MRVFRLSLLSLLLGLAASAHAATTTYQIQPNEADSEDTWIYQGLGTQNLDTTSLPPSGFFSTLGRILGTSNTGASLHNVASLIRFELPAGLLPQQVQSAHLKLYVLDGTTLGFAFANPSASTPVVTQARAMTEAWVENEATWDNDYPDPLPAVVGSTTLTGINQSVSIDLTDQVIDWLNGSSNLGLLLTQEAEVRTQGGLAVAGMYASSATLLGSQFRPMLEIVAVPEPTTWALGLLGAGALALVVRRRTTVMQG